MTSEWWQLREEVAGLSVGAPVHGERGSGLCIFHASSRMPTLARVPEVDASFPPQLFRCSSQSGCLVFAEVMFFQ